MQAIEENSEASRVHRYPLSLKAMKWATMPARNPHNA
jgi:hypothetical protein